MRFDLAGYDRNNRLILVAEAKNRPGTSESWAMEFRKNLLAHDDGEIPKYFLLAFPDRFYLWVNGSAQENRPPDFVADAAPLLQRYFERIGKPPERLGPDAFELLIGAWLGELTWEEFKRNDATRWLFDSGLLHDLAGGRLEHEVAV